MTPRLRSAAVIGCSAVLAVSVP
ncbi:MAG: hypothetical protein QOI71_614, partial [Gaiellales bacterium]|nr:hypothetical protein [Gaiellales bacterium]